MTSSTSTFVLSFDCEGKWGMASDPAMVDTHQIGNQSLKQAYESIFQILEQLGIPATFGIVGLFAQGVDAFNDFEKSFGSNSAYQAWFKHPKMAFQKGNTDGWFYPSLIEDIQRFGIHEISSHSYTHLPFHNESVTREIISGEFQLMKNFLSTKSVQLETFIYPRNQVAHTDLLCEFGIKGYRDSSPNQSAYGSKFKSLLDEINIYRSSESHSMSESPIRIPAGYFLNWRSGPRLLVPPRITIRRFNHLLDHAEKTNGVVHMWLHPHNLITGKEQVKLFEQVLKSVSHRQQNDQLKVLTMAEYCRSIEQSSAGVAKQ